MAYDLNADARDPVAYRVKLAQKIAADPHYVLEGSSDLRRFGYGVAAARDAVGGGGTWGDIPFQAQGDPLLARSAMAGLHGGKLACSCPACQARGGCLGCPHGRRLLAAGAPPHLVALLPAAP